MSSDKELTLLLQASANGSREALDKLLPAVYDELRQVASRQLSNERSNHTLQPTALVHEAYMRLITQHSVDWHNRAHFFSIAAEMMRRILVTHAVAKKAEKRGSGATMLALDELTGVPDKREVDLVILDEALQRLSGFDKQQARIVELKYFGGLTSEEIAEVMGVSVRTIGREWRTARAWLMTQLQD